MLIGSNKLVINGATLSAIIQEYLNNRLLDLTDHVKVTDVNLDTNTYNGRSFVVYVEPLKEPK